MKRNPRKRVPFLLQQLKIENGKLTRWSNSTHCNYITVCPHSFNIDAGAQCAPLRFYRATKFTNSGVRSPRPPVYCNHYGICVEPFDKLYHVGRDDPIPPFLVELHQFYQPVPVNCRVHSPFSTLNSQSHLDLESTPSATLRAKEGDSHDHRISGQTIRHHAGHTALLRAHRPDPAGTAHQKRHPRLRPDLVQLDRVY